MTEEGVMDPPAPPEPTAADYMKPAALRNQDCIILPRSLGKWDADESIGKDEQPYVECDVWILDRQGVKEEGAGVRITWVRTYAQLKDLLGRYIAARPVEAEGSPAVILTRLSDELRKVAAEVVADLRAGAAVVASTPDPDERPFTEDETF